LLKSRPKLIVTFNAPQASKRIMGGLEAHHLARFREPALQMENALAGP
jgi:hypothetical protein